MYIRTATPNDAEALLAIYAPYVMHTAITFEYEVPSLEDFRGRVEHTLERYPYIVAAEQVFAEKQGNVDKTAFAAGPAAVPSVLAAPLAPVAPYGKSDASAPNSAPNSAPKCSGSEATESTEHARHATERILGYAYAGAFKERAAYDWAIETSIYVAQEARGRGVGGRLHEALKEALVKRGIQNMCACITVVPEGLDSDPYITNNSMEFHRHLGYQLVGRFHNIGYKFDRWYDMVWMELMIGDHAIPAPELR